MTSSAIRRPWPDAYLILTTGLCGALVMVIEVLGSRVIGPFFGSSLFVWTALITVSLLSLAVGYALGGQLADRFPSRDWLYGLILVAGLLTALVPWIKPWVIEVSVPLGLRLGALVSSTLLFALPLLLLGCVSPYVVRIATSEMGQLGRTVGLLYAMSTAGSFVGTAATGFWVIGALGVSKAYLLTGALLVMLSVSYFVFFRRRWMTAAALVPVAALFLAAWGTAKQLPQARLADGTDVRMIEGRDSFYGSVKVVDYRGARGGIREMLINGLVQGGVDIDTGQSVYEYSYLLEILPMTVRPQSRSALLVGLGAGMVARGYAERGVDVEAVDIDPVVVDMAQKHFALRLPRPVVVDDARYHLARDGQRFDIVMMDAFTGDSSPSHLLTTEALARVRERLSQDGVLAINLIGRMGVLGPQGEIGRESLLLASVVRTLKTQFEHVLAFPMFDPASSQGGNIVLLARNGDLSPALNVPAASLVTIHPLAVDGVRQALGRARPVSAPEGIVLSDDFNPMDVLDVDLLEHVRQTIVNTTPREVLIHG